MLISRVEGCDMYVRVRREPDATIFNHMRDTVNFK